MKTVINQQYSHDVIQVLTWFSMDWRWTLTLHFLLAQLIRMYLQTFLCSLVEKKKYWNIQEYQKKNYTAIYWMQGNAHKFDQEVLCFDPHYIQTTNWISVLAILADIEINNQIILRVGQLIGRLIFIFFRKSKKLKFGKIRSYTNRFFLISNTR